MVEEAENYKFQLEDLKESVQASDAKFCEVTRKLEDERDLYLEQNCDLRGEGEHLRSDLLDANQQINNLRQEVSNHKY